MRDHALEVASRTKSQMVDRLTFSRSVLVAARSTRQKTYLVHNTAILMGLAVAMARY